MPSNFAYREQAMKHSPALMTPDIVVVLPGCSKQTRGYKRKKRKIPRPCPCFHLQFSLPRIINSPSNPVHSCVYTARTQKCSLLINKQYIPTVLQQDESFNLYHFFVPSQWPKTWHQWQDCELPGRNFPINTKSCFKISKTCLILPETWQNTSMSSTVRTCSLLSSPYSQSDQEGSYVPFYEGKYISWKVSVSTDGHIGWMPCDSLFLLYQL